MKAIVEILNLIRDNSIDKVSGLSLIERLKYARETARVVSDRSEVGKEARQDKALFLEQLKESLVIPTLRQIGSMSYFPMHLNGKVFEIKDRDLILDELIKNLTKYNTKDTK